MISLLEVARLGSGVVSNIVLLVSLYRRKPFAVYRWCFSILRGGTTSCSTLVYQLFRQRSYIYIYIFFFPGMLIVGVKVAMKFICAPPRLPQIN
jgi:hypothetical protein